jgi:Holliday junction resolvase RusA-like endonuclease
VGGHQVIRFAVRGSPHTQGSMRALRTKSGRIVVIPDEPQMLRVWRKAVREAAKAAMRGGEPWTGPIESSLEFVLHRPKKLPPERQGEPIVPPDLDKLERAVNDALTGTVFVDDAQVVGHFLPYCKRYAGPDEEPGALLQFRQLVGSLGEQLPLLDAGTQSPTDPETETLGGSHEAHP